MGARHTSGSDGENIPGFGCFLGESASDSVDSDFCFLAGMTSSGSGLDPLLFSLLTVGSSTSESVGEDADDAFRLTASGFGDPSFFASASCQINLIIFKYNKQTPLE